jgi:hypothetical protein
LELAEKLKKGAWEASEAFKTTKIQNQVQENILVLMFEDMTNASVLFKIFDQKYIA